MLRRCFSLCGGGKDVRFVLKQQADPYVRMAQRQGYVCRSAYKLREIDDKHNIFSSVKNAVVDLGAAPGSWCQVIRERVDPDAAVFAVDLLPQHARLHGVEFFQGDFSTPLMQSSLKKSLESRGVSGRIDVIVSDMCPNRGHRQERGVIARLNRNALLFATSQLKVGGHFVCKVLGSDQEFPELVELSRRWFKTTHRVKPAASRQASDENYLVGIDRLGVPRDRAAAVIQSRFGPRPVAGNFGLDDWPGSIRR